MSIYVTYDNKHLIINIYGTFASLNNLKHYKNFGTSCYSLGTFKKLENLSLNKTIFLF